MVENQRASCRFPYLDNANFSPPKLILALETSLKSSRFVLLDALRDTFVDAKWVLWFHEFHDFNELSLNKFGLMI